MEDDNQNASIVALKIIMALSLVGNVVLLLTNNSGDGRLRGLFFIQLFEDILKRIQS